MYSDTIAALSTAPGGAIGILRLSGPEAISIASSVFRPAKGDTLSEKPARMLVYGSLFSRQGNLIDRCMAVIFPGQETYTGEPMAEIQCHGSPAVLGEGLAALFAAGARQAEAGEFTRRAFLNGKLELTEAEAVGEIIAAQTAQAAQNAAEQLAGAVAGPMAEIRQALVGMEAHFLAVVDYPDEDIDPFFVTEASEILSAACGKLSALADSFEKGQILREGLPCAIIGRPNVGKSTLLNALVGFDRAIVTDIAGTTRDTIEETIRIGPLCLRLQDTAGLRDTDDPVEQLGVLRAQAAAEKAGLVIAVFDASSPLTQEDETVFKALSDAKRALIVWNKCDKAGEKPDLPCNSALPAVSISAKTGQGLDDLRDALLSCTGLDGLQFDGGVITNARQAAALTRAADSCAHALASLRQGVTPDAILLDVEQAIDALGELTGQTVRQDVITEIFSRFCVGK